MAKRLIIAFDVVDENDNSIIDWQYNANEIDISDDVTPLDITRLWMDMHRYTMYAPAHPGISHLFPYMAPLIEEAQGGNTSGKPVENPLVIYCSHRKIGHPLQNRKHEKVLPEILQR